MDKARFTIHITGKVQGVFYRKSACAEALRLGLAGTVRNLADGSVLAEAEGDPDRLEDFVRWCRQGPPRAVVAAVQVSAGTPTGLSGFTIQR